MLSTWGQLRRGGWKGARHAVRCFFAAFPSTRHLAKPTDVYGATHHLTLQLFNNLMVSLFEVGQYAEAKKYLRQFLPTIRDACGPDHRATLAVREDLALAILGRGSSREERVEGIAILEEVTEKLRRVLGDAHPDTRRAKSRLAAVVDNDPQLLQTHTFYDHPENRVAEEVVDGRVVGPLTPDGLYS